MSSTSVLVNRRVLVRVLGRWDPAACAGRPGAFPGVILALTLSLHQGRGWKLLVERALTLSGALGAAGADEGFSVLLGFGRRGRLGARRVCRCERGLAALKLGAMPAPW